MKIRIAISMPENKPPEPVPTSRGDHKKCTGVDKLLKKVEYAIECIELDEPNWEQALKFIRQVACKLEKQKPMRPEYLKILDLTRPILSMLGTYGDQDGPE